jgi:hypothetical protein
MSPISVSIGPADFIPTLLPMTLSVGHGCIKISSGIDPIPGSMQSLRHHEITQTLLTFCSIRIGDSTTLE